MINYACEQMQEWLPAYSNNTLEPEATSLLQQHLTTCTACKKKLAGWLNIAVAIGDVAASSGSQLISIERVLNRILVTMQTDTINKERAAFEPINLTPVRKLSHLLQILVSQGRLIRQGLWIASALIMLIGVGVALVISSSGVSGTLLAIVAPVVAAIGIAFIYGPENDPAIELTLTTPVSPQLILLSRLILVFGYNLVLTFSVTLILAITQPTQYFFWSLILLWLGPMLFLSSFSLILSLIINPNAAIVMVMLLWILRLLSLTDIRPTLVSGLFEQVSNIWGQTNLSIVLVSICLLAFAFIFVQRQERVL